MAVLERRPHLVCEALRLPSTNEIYGYVIVRPLDRRRDFGGGRTPAEAWESVYRKMKCADFDGE